MPRVLIAGAGSIGRRHLQNLRQLGVHDIHLYRTHSRPLNEAPELPVFTDLKQALECKPQAVIVSNPTAFHIEIALAAARAGCHLFIEKPLAHSWDGIEELLSIVDEKRLVAMVGFDLRFDPGLCRIKALLEQEQIGPLIAIHAQVGQYLPDWRTGQDYRDGMSARRASGGGVILDLIHELDYTSWLFGPIAQVACFANKLSNLEIETEDTASILLKFRNGAIGTVNLDYVQRVPSRTCRVIGELGTILWDYHGQKVAWYRHTNKSWEEFDYSGFERNDRFLAEMRHFLACLNGEEIPKVNLVVGSLVLKVALAAKHSASTGSVCGIDA
jgi:predicted dehydrogenase